MTSRLKRALAALGSGALLVVALVVAGPTVPANAHGYVSDPMSRQAQCAAGLLECGQIQWEPHSVEGPKGLTSCSGGNSRFAELDDDSKGWQHTQVGTSVDFTWTITANHSTSTWQYFIGDTLVAEFDDGGAQPPDTVTHNVDLSGFSGDQKLLAVWNVADTANAFYACVDLTVG